MYAISTGNHPLEENITPLERAAESLEKLGNLLITDDLRRKANLVEILIKEQVSIAVIGLPFPDFAGPMLCHILIIIITILWTFIHNTD